MTEEDVQQVDDEGGDDGGNEEGDDEGDGGEAVVNDEGDIDA